jgi:hypothetical protein
MPAMLAAALLTAASDRPPDLATGFAAELDRARSGLETAAPADERAAPLARLERARIALAAGRFFLAAYLLEAPWEGANNFLFVKASADVTTAEQFVKKWTAMGEPRPRPFTPTLRAPAIAAALAAAAEARGPTTYHASRPYAEDAGVFGGLYYLADSHSVIDFAAMVRALPWPPSASPPPFRSVATEIAALDAAMTTAYEKMERSSHPTYISASAALKQAHTLNDRGQFGGALFEYLLARYLFAPLRGPASSAATAERIAAARSSLPANVDHSVAELFLQLADEGVASASETQRRGAAAALEDVLPAYLAAIGATAASTTAGDTAQVTITLVRWPFT